MAQNGFDSVSVGLRMAIDGKSVINGGTSGQCAAIKRQFRTAKHIQGTKQPSNGGGRDANERLFVCYPEIQYYGGARKLRSRRLESPDVSSFVTGSSLRWHRHWPARLAVVPVSFCNDVRSISAAQ